MLASMIMRFLRDIKQPRTHEVVIVYDCKADPSWRRQLSITAETIFTQVTEIETPRSLDTEGWPHGPNWMHKITAQWMHENRIDHPWFWFEPDCTPLVANWVSVLEEEHEFNGTPFTGNIQRPGPKDTYWTHVSGCRISPGDFYNRYGYIYDGITRAFDVEAADKIVPETAQTNRMFHEYFRDIAEDIILEHAPVGGYSKIIPAGYVMPVFTSVDEVETLISRGYVIHHRCKDGSLLKYAREYHNLD